ncbi:NAD(P)-dependent alcohol dehydrogenase [Actinoplanes sp. NBRC 101535]|uniref:NAD(P)-dependent alcohol dehydrogenase n=1 Tax=Actinoplanes sp. NBRC 101535 TaxID=3032196 RepID=UPI0024A18E60|nr:NAD(P)-dependent alcohol dehydrogenase [Actinoplanes sp. NBRC 101535]GLX99639.1 NADPH:quinone reductase [Actinoplanes sp. NBRC 101535]
MKAIVQDVYGEADVLAVRDIPRPVPKTGEVLIRVMAAGVDPGVWHLMTGRPYLIRAALGPRRPRIPVRGRDLAGVVETAGPESGFQPGDEVFGTCEGGSFAEFAVARADRIARKPAGVPFVDAAAVPVSGTTALQAVRYARITTGRQVLVIGAGGGVGSFAVQLAVAAGARVTGVCSPGKADMVRGLGAEHVLDYHREEVDSRGPIFDAVVDTAGNRPLSLLRRALNSHGILVLIGGERHGTALFGGISRALVAAPLLSLTSGDQRLHGLLAKENAADLTELAALLESGTLRPAVDRTYPLAHAPEALAEIGRGHTGGKMVITLA